MKLSYDWLSDYVDLTGLSAQDVADKLTMGAFEVEEIRQVGSNLVGPVVVGEIVAISPHPNADKIRLTTVRVNESEPGLEIVCGADNIIVGQRVPVALPGARVINRHDGTPLPIKQTKIRGTTSNGMLCSPPELGLPSVQADGIYIFEGQPQLGVDVLALLNLRPDWVLHVEPRSNRGDALSVVGMAREVAALFGRSLKEPSWQLPSEDYTSMEVPISIGDLSDCPFFSVRVLEGLCVRPAPVEISRRLEAIGVRPVNNLVDITNYVLHEYGQPLHAYDLAQINGSRLSVRRAGDSEKLVTIDGRERDLNDEVLVIADAERVVGVAGVMGGKGSEVSEETSFIALEAAAFAPARVRRSSRLIGLSSDSSVRFERGVDVSSVVKASDRAAYLMLKSCKGYLGKLTCAGSDSVKSVNVPLRLGQIKRLIEVDIKGEEVASMLRPLGFDVTGSGEALAVSVPTFRQQDVKREIDVIEEVCRLWGYDRIPESMPAATVAPALPDLLEKATRDALSGCGLNETWISSLVSEDPFADGHGKASSTLVRVLNPLSADHQVMRQSLIPGLIQAVAYNHDRGRSDVWLFEIGRVYKRHGQASDKDPGAAEELHVGAVVSGEAKLSTWIDAKDAVEPDYLAFFNAKGCLTNLISHLGIAFGRCRFEKGADEAGLFHPGRACRVYVDDTALGWLGEVHPRITNSVGLRATAAVFELSLEACRKVRSRPAFQEIAATPVVSRDLTVDVPATTDQEKVAAVVISAAGPLLRAVNLVSVFDLGDSVKSLSYRLSFQHLTETLTNEAIGERLEEVRRSLKEKLSATFRS